MARHTSEARSASYGEAAPPPPAAASPPAAAAAHALADVAAAAAVPPYMTAFAAPAQQQQPAPHPLVAQLPTAAGSSPPSAAAVTGKDEEVRMYTASSQPAVVHADPSLFGTSALAATPSIVPASTAGDGGSAAAAAADAAGGAANEAALQREAYFRGMAKSRADAFAQLEACINETHAEVAECKTRNLQLSRRLAELDALLDEERRQWTARVAEDHGHLQQLQQQQPQPSAAYAPLSGIGGLR